MVNIEAIINNLKEFYSLKDKIITHVGIGGGILVGYTKDAREVIATDNNAEILKPLTEKLIHVKLEKKFTIILTDYNKFTVSTDTTFFEFCMHEMENPYDTVLQAKGLSSTVLIADHGINSEWAYYTCETEKIENSWKEIEKFKIIKRERFEEYQIFNSYEEIYNKLSVLGEESIGRIKEFEGKTDFKIRMPYEICLI